MSTHLSDYQYDLPERLIAQTPLPRRDASRLMRVPLSSEPFSHTTFDALPGLLRPGDCLVVNDSRVLPARLLGQTASGGAVELLLLRDTGDLVWECLAKPGKKARDGARLSFGGGLLTAQVIEVTPEANRLVRFTCDGIFLEMLDKLGQMPLPPYIHEQLDDPERYQTVYAKVPGSAAAPTAGLHFTPELLQHLADRGIQTASLTLHVGLGTFRPVKVDDIADHVMHAEYACVPTQTVDCIRNTRRTGGRVVAVGTTVCRALESACRETGTLTPFSGFTDIFITPGYTFRAIDGLITNFHLPGSTLLMLVSALAGRTRILDAYREAISQEYRFFSFGDAMLLL